MGVAISGSQYLWPSRTIAYVIDPTLHEPARVLAAVEHWNLKTVIRFVERTNEADFVRVTRVPGGAASFVGRRRGEQAVSIGDGTSVGGIIHELGHAVGLWHEHCRHDRDDFVTIDRSNIQDDCIQNFEIDSIPDQPGSTVDIGDYDYSSIMHYPEMSTMAIDESLPTMVPTSPLQPGVILGQRVGLSSGDIDTVATLYRGVAAPSGEA